MTARLAAKPGLGETAPPSPRSRIARQRGGVSRRWSALPIRAQLLIAIGLVCLCAALAMGVLAVIRGNDRARVEVMATLEIAERMISETVRGLPGNTPPETIVNHVSQQLRYFRHVRVSFAGARGRTSQIEHAHGPAKSGGEAERAPAWFVRLVSPVIPTREVPLILNGAAEGVFLVAGEPGDEIAEVWDDMSETAGVAAVLVAAMFAMLFVALGRVLGSLGGLGEGMQELEIGHYGARLKVPEIKELAPIARRFNALAEALDGARAENRDLLNHLIKVQEDERREVATELHDEAGPCLFGITANAGSIVKFAREGAAAPLAGVEERVSAILDCAERLKAVNRRLLKTLRPVAIGRVSLEELLSDLVAEFEKRHPDVGFFLSIEPIAPRYGEAIELTIYRCLQQGLTNALQHGKAANIDARLAVREALAPGKAKRKELVLTLADDGTGIADRTPAGFGLSAMRERVLALDGVCAIGRAEPRGTIVTIAIPIADRAAPAPSRALSCENAR